MAQSAKPLALTDVAHGEQKGWRRGQHLVDALPYVDGLTPAEKQAVDKLIEEEVRSRHSRPAWGPCRSGQCFLPPPAAGRPLACCGETSTRSPGACRRLPQMRSSSKKPSEYLSELPPLPETRFKASAALRIRPARCQRAACCVTSLSSTCFTPHASVARCPWNGFSA